MAYKEEVKCLESRQELGDSFLQSERWAEAICTFLSPPSIEPQSQQAGAVSETPSTWLTLSAHTGDPETLPTQLMGPHKLFTDFSYE